jgi:hypothetical protein
MKDGQSRAQDSKDNYATTKADETEEDLGDSDTYFNGLEGLVWYRKEWRRLTRSFALAFSACLSCFSTANSSLNVGLSGFRVRAGVPGTRRALFKGELGTA